MVRVMVGRMFLVMMVMAGGERRQRNQYHRDE
jgi:hypothetical protein